MRRKRFLLVLAGLFCAPGVFAEAQGAGLSGKILLDDGMPPLTPIAIELVCKTQVVRQTRADDEGRFTLPPSSSHPAPSACILRASLSGYRAASIRLADMPEHPDVAALVLHREGKWQGAAISVTWLAAPAAARKAFHAAIREMRRGSEADLAGVARALQTAVKEYPQYAAAWYELGRLRLREGDSSGAREALGKAVAADPWFISPYQPLLLLELGEQRWLQVRNLCNRMLAMNPYLSDAHYYRGLAGLNLGDLESARQAADAIEKGPEAGKFALRYHLRGLIYESERNLQAAAAQYRKYLSAEPDSPIASGLRSRLVTWETEGRVIPRTDPNTLVK